MYETCEHEINFISYMAATYSGFLIATLSKQCYNFLSYR